MSHETTSSSLLQRVKQHEAEAWDRLVHVYSPLIYDWCRQQGLQPVDAADVSQEVFRAVMRTIERFRRERPSDSFRGWLWTVTRNKIRDSLRAKASGEQATGGTTMMRRMQDLPDAEPVPSSGPSDSEITNDPFRRAVESLRAEFEDRTWQAFWRVAVDQQPTADVAEELGISVNAVRKAKSRVLRRMREEFGDLLNNH
jgi:RNA polymerase sigma-70 factor (ECF subfamily)